MRLVAAEDWREKVKKDKLERKLRKMAYRLGRLAHDNGIEHIDIFAIDNPERGETFVCFGADDHGREVASDYKFIKWGGEADA